MLTVEAAVGLGAGVLTAMAIIVVLIQADGAVPQPRDGWGPAALHAAVPAPAEEPGDPDGTATLHMLQQIRDLPAADWDTDAPAPELDSTQTMPAVDRPGRHHQGQVDTVPPTYGMPEHLVNPRFAEHIALRTSGRREGRP